ncbi:protein ROS1 [Prunus avium]|uniref:Protein ROS1 n=1 Tax=Prunus avium TaxID=42229 RepID=A0A6P5RMF4_PRUAV|nr:protein ROS1 [Prunus avium]
MRGSFPLNGTYFQVNEVFADHDSSYNPIDVPRQWIWNLPRRTAYFGASVTSIFRGLSTVGIQYCFWKGYVCVRGFDRKTRGPRHINPTLHMPASELTKTKKEEKR